MKIALVCPYNMFERTGGVQQLVTHLHDGLTKKGHSVKVITQRPSGFKGDAPEDYILFGAMRDFKGGLGVSGDWGMPSDREEIDKILRKEKFDVINFHEPWVPILAWQMLKHSKAAHVGTFHANLVDNAAAKSWVNVFMPYGRGIGQKMHVLTAVSPAPASLLLSKANGNVKEKKLIENIRYIPNGIDLDAYKPPKKRLPLNGPNTKTVVFVGRLDRRKGIDWLIKAFALLETKMPNAYLIIAGEGTRRNKLEQLADSLGIKNIHFTGYVNEAEKRRLMGNADVFCSPAMFGESFGIVLIEAMAMGAPVIAGRNAGYINVLTDHGKIGLVDSKATEEFADRLSIFMTDDKINGMLRSWGLREVKKYNYQKIIGQYEAAYKEALQLLTEERRGRSAVKDDEKRPKRLIHRVFVRRHAR
ncbi:MAG TPA: glycosyltransferase family 4 protein [Candidatus Saccharimonadales bacterium]|nr:glycosyltransferase family 4 protein [Candidatus Saccharimonadales bacterium]